MYDIIGSQKVWIEITLNNLTYHVLCKITEGYNHEILAIEYHGNDVMEVVVNLADAQTLNKLITQKICTLISE